MCGRYQFSADEYKEIRQIVRDAQHRSEGNELNFPMAGEPIFFCMRCVPAWMSFCGLQDGDCIVIPLTFLMRNVYKYTKKIWDQ